MCGWAPASSASAPKARRVSSAAGRAAPDEHTGAGHHATGNPQKVARRHRDAPLCRRTRPAPAMQEDSRAAATSSLAVPVGDEHQIVEPVGASQPLMRVWMRGTHPSVVVRIGRVVRPQVSRSDRASPRGWSRQPVGSVQHSGDAETAGRRSAVTLPLFDNHPRSTDGARHHAPLKPHAGRCQHQIPRRHSRCPDLRALTSR